MSVVWLDSVDDTHFLFLAGCALICTTGQHAFFPHLRLIANLYLKIFLIMDAMTPLTTGLGRCVNSQHGCSTASFELLGLLGGSFHVLGNFNGIVQHLVGLKTASPEYSRSAFHKLSSYVACSVSVFIVYVYC